MTNDYIIPADSPSIYDVVDSVSTLEQQAIIRPNNPPPGIAGYLFNIPEEDAINLRSQISRHYLEDNTAISDHIALEPEEYTVRGLVAELVNTKTVPTPQPTPQPQTLPINPDIAPVPRFSMAQGFAMAQTLSRALAPGAGQIINIARALSSDPATVQQQITDTAQDLAIRVGLGTEAAQAMALGKLLMSATKSSAVPTRSKSTLKSALGQPPSSLYNVFNNKAGSQPSQTWQSKTFNYFYQLYLGRQLFTVETPFGFFSNMAILSLTAVQDDRSRFQSSFAITFQHIRFAGAATVTVGQLAGRLGQQAATTTQNGAAGQKQVQPTEKQSLLYQMLKAP